MMEKSLENKVSSGTDTVIDELKKKRDRFLDSLMAKQSIVSIELRNGKMVIGIYFGHDNEHIVVTREGKPITIAFLDTESMKRL